MTERWCLGGKQRVTILQCKEKGWGWGNPAEPSWKTGKRERLIIPSRSCKQLKTTCLLDCLWSPIWFLTVLSLPWMPGCQVPSWLASLRRRRKNNLSNISSWAWGGSFWSCLTLSLHSGNPCLPRPLDVCRLGTGSLGGTFKREKQQQQNQCLFPLRFEGRERRETSDRSFWVYNNFWIRNFLFTNVSLNGAKWRRRSNLVFCILLFLQ